MTIRSRTVAVLSAIKPRRVCDQCLATILKLKTNRDANRVTRDLQGEYGYRRETGVCSRCEKGERLVIGRTK